MDDNNAATTTDETGVSRLPCWYCERRYTSWKSMLVHMRRKHDPTVADAKLKPGPCLKCGLCGEESVSRKKFEEHFPSVHDVPLETVNLTFASEEEFSTWKANEEKRNNCLFVRRSGTKNYKDGRKVSYMYCHRSGTFVSRSRGQRRLKSQGSNKMSGLCPSTVKWEMAVNSPLVYVTYCKTHVGHFNDPGRLKQAKTARTDLQDLVPVAAASGTAVEPSTTCEEEICFSIFGESLDAYNVDDLDFQWLGT